MGKAVLCGYFALWIILTIVYFRNHSAINRFEKRSKTIEHFHESIQKIKDYRNTIVKNDITLKNGKVYFYDANNNYISVVEKESYKEYDLFVFSHEIGHSIECFLHPLIYKVISIINVLVLLFYLASVIMNVIFIIKHPFPRELVIALNSVTVIVFAIKLMSLYWIEKNASLQAVKIMKRFRKLNDCYDNVIELSIINQYVYHFMIFSTVLISFIVSVFFKR